MRLPIISMCWYDDGDDVVIYTYCVLNYHSASESNLK